MNIEVEVTYKRIKNYILKVRNGKVLVSVPFHTSKEKIEEFVNKNIDFINKNLNKQEVRKEKRNINYNDEILILNKKYQILPISLKSKITDNFVFVNDKVEDIRKEIKRLFKEKQYDYFYLKTKYYFSIMGLQKVFPKIIIKDVKSKWGSYAKQSNTLVYASEAIFKDEDAIDYLIVHELAHMIEYNHSANFYKIVSKYCPKYKELRKKLKE